MTAPLVAVLGVDMAAAPSRRRWLDVSGNNLNGTLPSEIGAMTALVSLNVSWNALSGSLPATLSNLTNLQHLDASFQGSRPGQSGGGLTGTLPSELSGMISLRCVLRDTPTTVDLATNYFALFWRNFTSKHTRGIL